MRSLVLVLSAITAVTEALQLALDDGAQVTWQHLLAAGAIALCTWVARSPWDRRVP